MYAIREKRANEKYPVGYDFAHELAAASETIASVTSTVDTGLTREGDPAYSGTQAYQNISGGTAGAYYFVTLKITTSAGNIYEKPFLVRVIADLKPPTISARALVSLDDAKNYIGKVTDEDTAMLESIISAVSDVFNAETNRTLAKATYTNLYLDGNGQQILWLPNWPIIGALAAIMEDDVALVEGEDEDYFLYADEGYLWRISGVWLRGPKTIKLTYDAGYVCLTGTITLPNDLKLAALKQVAYEFDRYMKKDLGLDSITYPDGSISRQQVGLLKEVREVLVRYRSYR